MEYVKKYNRITARGMVNYLDRFVTLIQSPMDVVRMFSGLTIGQAHHLDRGLRGLLNFCELMGYNETWLNQLRKAIPKDQIGVDLKVPEEAQIIACLAKMSRLPLRCRALWELCLDSGARAIEAMTILNEFEAERLQQVGDVCLYEIAAFRGFKQAYYTFFTPSILDLIQKARKTARKKIVKTTAAYNFNRHGVIAPKYLRKFAFDSMTSEHINIPESVADFIEGRVPKTVGARHYMKLKRQAIEYYPRYAAYIKDLGSKAGLN